jgi:tRNA(Ile)-lysidine synthetase-like protein
MSGLSAKVRLYNSFIDDECSKRLIWSKTGDGWKINGKIFFNEHTLLRIQSVYSRLNTFQTVKKRIKFTALEKALSGGEPESGKILLQTAAFEVIYRNGYIFTQRLVNHNKKSYLLYLKPEKEYHTSGQIFKMFYDAADDDDDAQQLSLSAGTPLIVRSFREGDSIMIRDGRKSIKKLFNEWKVSSDERMRIPIVEDPDGIAAVIGLHLGYENKTAFGREDTGTIHKRVLLNFKAATETTGE